MVEKAKKTRKILVTGSNGMLGTDLCRELATDYEIVGLHDTESGPPHILCDIADRNKTIKSIVGANPELIIHAAAWTDVDACEGNPDKAKRINEDGTQNVALSALEIDIPLIYISTDFIFDGSKKRPYTEKDVPNPLNIYSKYKLAGEEKIKVLNKYVILRTSWLYGKNGNNFVDAILDKAKSEKEIKVVDDQIGSPTYTKDFAGAIRSLLRGLENTFTGKSQKVQEIYHISNKGTVSWFDYAKEIMRIAKIKNVALIPIKSTELARPAKRPAFSALDNRKYEKVSGFTMRSWQEAIRDYITEKQENMAMLENKSL